MTRALELESQRWAQDVAPQKLDGHCHSELAIDILQVPLTVLSGPWGTGTATALMSGEPGGGGDLRAPAPRPSMYILPCSAPAQARGGWYAMLSHCPPQIISQGQTKAENITSDVGMQIKQLLMVELAALLRR